jgi:hypothetical protein
MRRVIEADYAGFEIYLKSEKFNQLVQLIENRSVDSVGMYVRYIDGVYADWTPTIKTSSAKFLTSDKLIDGVEGTNFEGTVVTRVGDFDISFNTQATLNTKQFLPTIDFAKEFDDDSPTDFDEGSSNNYQASVKNDDAVFQQLIQIVKSLKTALWFVFAVLLFLLFK